MVKAHRAGFRIEGEDVAQADVRAVSIARRRGPALSVTRDVSRRVDDGPVDVAGYRIVVIHAGVCLCLGTGRQQQGQVRAGRHGDHADFFRIEASGPGLAAHETDSALTVFPGCLVDGKPFRAWGAVHEIHALNAAPRQFLFPISDEPHVAAVHVGSAGDEDHADIFPERIGGRREPFEVGDAVGAGQESRGAGFVGHRRNLAGLSIRHPSCRPDVFALLGRERKTAAEQEKGQETFHGARSVNP